MTFDVPLTEELDLDRLREAVEPVWDEVYRIKGFADVGGRRFHVDYSSTQWNCEEVAGGPPPALVLIVPRALFPGRPPTDPYPAARYLAEREHHFGIWLADPQSRPIGGRITLTR